MKERPYKTLYLEALRKSWVCLWDFPANASPLPESVLTAMPSDLSGITDNPRSAPFKPIVFFRIYT
jgi:hypothetical protein